MKLREKKCCKDCESCVDLFNNGVFYCNMKICDKSNSQADIITCLIKDPDAKLEDCPWDKASDFVESLSYEDQLGLKCLAKMFGGKDNNFFEDEPSEVVHPEPSCYMTYMTNCSCDHCGVQLIREDDFCRCCGRKIEWSK